MKRGHARAATGSVGCQMALISILFLLVPGSFSVLCIAPGSHIAIENINAACCRASHDRDFVTSHEQLELRMTGDCANCIDLFLTQSGPEAIRQPHSDNFRIISAEDNESSVCNLLTIYSDPLLFRRDSDRDKRTNHISSFAPLRC